MFDNNEVDFKKLIPYQIENWCLEFAEIYNLVDETWGEFSQGSSMFFSMEKISFPSSENPYVLSYE